MAMSKSGQVLSPPLMQAVLLAFALAWCIAGATGSGESTAAAMEENSQLPESAFQSSFVARRLSQSTGDQKFLFGCSSTSCSAPKTCCNSLLLSTCTDLQTDDINCGSCGKKCLISLFKCCNGQCTNFLTDTNNCGKCGNVCKGKYPKCVLGLCNYGFK